MHNALTRVQNTFGLFTTTAFVVALFIALTDFVAPRAPSAEIIPSTIQVCVPPSLRPLSTHRSGCPSQHRSTTTSSFEITGKD